MDQRGKSPGLGGQTLGGWSVLCFFGISGHVITRSRMNGGPGRRFPVPVSCASSRASSSHCCWWPSFAPLSVLGSPGTFTLGDYLSYVARNLFLYPPFASQTTIGTTLAEGKSGTAPWILVWEACCYVGVGILELAALRPRSSPAPGRVHGPQGRCACRPPRTRFVE